MIYTKEKLIFICKKAIVKQSQWKHRESSQAQINTGIALALLKAGCEFKIITKDDEPDTRNEKSLGCFTDYKVIWIQFYVKDFFHFENPNKGENGRGAVEYLFYLPTIKTIKAAKGADWYNLI